VSFNSIFAMVDDLITIAGARWGKKVHNRYVCGVAKAKFEGGIMGNNFYMDTQSWHVCGFLDYGTLMTTVRWWPFTQRIFIIQHPHAWSPLTWYAQNCSIARASLRMQAADRTSFKKFLPRGMSIGTYKSSDCYITKGRGVASKNSLVRPLRSGSNQSTRNAACVYVFQWHLSSCNIL
jgi:hypothetical protein